MKFDRWWCFLMRVREYDYCDDDDDSIGGYVDNVFWYLWWCLLTHVREYDDDDDRIGGFDNSDGIC